MLFILVVLGGLAAVIAQLSSTQHLGISLALQGKQAWYAARAGSEWGIQRAVTDGSCLESTEWEIEGFTVTVRCRRVGEFAEGGETYQVFRLQSEAIRLDPLHDRIQREIHVSVWRLHS